MFEILDEFCVPKKGTKHSACIDLCAREDVVIGAGQTVLVPLGVKIDFDKLFKMSTGGVDIEVIRNMDKESLARNANEDTCSDFMKSHQLNLHIRSSMSAKHGLIIANGTGIIDLDYPGEIMICIHKPFRFRDIFAVPYDFVLDLVLGKNRKLKSYSKYFISASDRVAQISLVEHKSYLFGVESEDERVGGLGSTGV